MKSAYPRAWHRESTKYVFALIISLQFILALLLLFNEQPNTTTQDVTTREFLSFPGYLPCLQEGLGAPAACQPCASEVGELSSVLHPPETSRLHVISKGESSPRDLHLNAKTQHPLNDQQATVQDTLCQSTSKTRTQPHPLAERLPNIIRSQASQNTPPDVVLPTRKTISSLIHQNTGTSPFHQEAYITH